MHSDEAQSAQTRRSNRADSAEMKIETMVFALVCSENPLITIVVVVVAVVVGKWKVKRFSTKPVVETAATADAAAAPAAQLDDGVRNAASRCTDEADGMLGSTSFGCSSLVCCSSSSSLLLPLLFPWLAKCMFIIR